ncbi:hypothetical protein J437_LFUL000100 [Ladona fulva]|uniref:E2F/DP family winged-helix DNA-binding domain-containing protein n=1 Tax=Ladona fulva TaxID=123851 RepID=A0A8K0K546_LADFU|nr:hypothetical protein J437_LFUL000100 [Ladona fulva]
MAQQGNTLNFLIHDANGQPQVIKVVQATSSKPLTISNPKVFFKTPGQDVGQTTVLRTIGIQGTKPAGTRPPQVVTIPIQAAASPVKASPLKGLGPERHATILPQTLQFTTTPMVKSLQVLGTPQRLNTATSTPGTASTLPTATAVVVSGLGTGASTARGQLNLGSNVVTATTQPTVVHAQQNTQVNQQQSQQNQHQQQQQQQTPAALPKNYISPILDHSGSRKRQETEQDYTIEFKRRKTEKVGKGLRHFSMKVCEKVRRKGTTSYNEVADELVAEFTNPVSMSAASDQYDQKNIRRRVYDALNVLMAMSIISKEKKEIRWLGLPTNSLQECRALEVDRKRRLERIRHKTRHLHDLIIQVLLESLYGKLKLF